MATKAKKREIVSELTKFFTEAKVAMVADLSGFTVLEITNFRRKLINSEAKCRIAKNTLIKIATKEQNYAALESLAKGPSAFIVGYNDPVAAAKTTVEYLKDLKKGVVRGGVLDGKLISGKEVENLSKLPSREQLLASIMGSLDAGARDIAGTLANVISSIAVLVEEVAKEGTVYVKT